MYRRIIKRVVVASAVVLVLLVPVWELSICTPASVAAEYNHRVAVVRVCRGTDGSTTPFALYSKPSHIAHYIANIDQRNLDDLLHKSGYTVVNASIALLLALVYLSVWFVIGTKIRSVWAIGYTALWFVQIVPFVAYAWILNTLVGDWDKIVFGFIVCAFPIVGKVQSGVNRVGSSQRELLDLYQASHMRRLKHLYFPNVIGSLFSGLYLAVPLAMIGVLIGDLSMGENVGLGAKIAVSVRNNQAHLTWLYTLSAVTLSIGILFAVAVIEFAFARCFRWYLDMHGGTDDA